MGNVTIGAMGGIVRILNTDGNVSIAQATEALQLASIKGTLEATLTELGLGLPIAAVGGPITLHFLQEPDTRISGRSAAWQHQRTIARLQTY